MSLFSLLWFAKLNALAVVTKLLLHFSYSKELTVVTNLLLHLRHSLLEGELSVLDGCNSPAIHKFALTVTLVG
jgi:hypothetical protein